MSDSRELAWVRAQIDCRHPTAAPTTINGRTVYQRNEHGTEWTWICLSIGFPLTIRVEQRAGAADALSTTALDRMVASAQRLPAGRAPGNHYELVPPEEVRHMGATSAGSFFLPSRLPAGFIFSRQRVLAHDPGGDGRCSLLVTFGRDGLLLEWRVYAGVDRLGLDCPAKHSALAPKPAAMIDRRRVYFGAGIHGARAWRCVPARAVGNPQPLEIELWYDIRLDGATMRREVLRLVTAAKPRRER